MDKIFVENSTFSRKEYLFQNFSDFFESIHHYSMQKARFVLQSILKKCLQKYVEKTKNISCDLKKIIESCIVDYRRRYTSLLKWANSLNFSHSRE